MAAHWLPGNKPKFEELAADLTPEQRRKIQVAETWALFLTFTHGLALTIGLLIGSCNGAH